MVMLVAMATGTGKTKLAIALLYRLISNNRFRRVCFVVDRSALGNQTADEFTSTKVVSTKTFANIFGIKGLKDRLNRCFGEVKKGESPTKHSAKLSLSSWHYEQTRRWQYVFPSPTRSVEPLTGRKSF